MTQHVGPSNPISWPCVTWQPYRADLICHATQSLATQCLGIVVNQFISHMIQYFCIISQFRLSLAISHVYACAGVPKWTIYITMPKLSILTKHTLTYQHDNSTFIFINHIVTRQWPLVEASESFAAVNFMLVIVTAKLAAVTTSISKSQQSEPTHCSGSQSRCNECSLSQPAKAQTLTGAYWLQRELILLQRVVTVLTNHHIYLYVLINKINPSQNKALLCCRHTTILTSLPKPFFSVCEMLHALGTIDVFF